MYVILDIASGVTYKKTLYDKVLDSENLYKITFESRQV